MSTTIRTGGKITHLLDDPGTSENNAMRNSNTLAHYPIIKRFVPNAKCFRRMAFYWEKHREDLKKLHYSPKNLSYEEWQHFSQWMINNNLYIPSWEFPSEDEERMYYMFIAEAIQSGDFQS